MSLARATAQLDQDSFATIAALASRECGLRLVPGKILMVQSRLRHRLRALQLDNFPEYCSLVCSEDGRSERRMMISALTTNVSHFFREPHHFDLLVQHMLPGALHRLRRGGRVRIWSAGCSNGQEPYSIAIRLLKEAPELAHGNFRILATDIDPNVIAFGQAGRYPTQQLEGMSPEDRDRFFRPDPKRGDDGYVVNDSLLRLVTFRELNLLSDWPMRQSFDAIFCRNVVIYFDASTQNQLWPRFLAQLRDGGLFFLGHSERMADHDGIGFENAGTTAYRKRGMHAVAAAAGEF